MTKDNFDKHQRANAKLVDPSIGCKHVPVRLYVDANPPLQDVIPPTHFNGIYSFVSFPYFYS
jgi:hypothetical protein